MQKIFESQGKEILNKLYAFYSKRYSSDKAEMEKKFNDAAMDLVGEGDLTRREYMEFCVDNDIEPRKKKKSSGGSSSGGDSCGGGGGGMRGGC
jgi:hypothetical protein